MMIRVALLVLLLCSSARADDAHTDVVHLTAHAGASFALQTVFYGVNRRAFGLSQGEAEALAFIETLAVGVLYKTLEAGSTGDDFLRASAQNALGAGLAVGTHVLFRF